MVKYCYLLQTQGWEQHDKDQQVSEQVSRISHPRFFFSLLLTFNVNRDKTRGGQQVLLVCREQRRISKLKVMESAVLGPLWCHKKVLHFWKSNCSISTKKINSARMETS